MARVQHAYPNIGGDIGALPVLRKIVDNGHKLMLWTHERNRFNVLRSEIEEALNGLVIMKSLYGVLMRTHYKRNWLV
jgi:hypothetical protein